MIAHQPKWGELIDLDDPSKGKYFPLHKFQKEAYYSTTRFTACIAGTGGGKTVLGPLWSIKQITQHFAKSKTPILAMVVAPTYKVLSRATVPTLIDTFKGTQLEGVYKEATNLYVLPNNWGRIWCQGADNAGGLEGGQFDFIWLDEGGQVKYSVWAALQGRTGLKQAPILITTTPYGKNWLYYEFYDAWTKKDPNYKVIQWSSFQNPAYPKEEYERAKASMTKEKGAMRYDGSFMDLEGKIYKDIESCYVDLDDDEIIKLLSGSGKFYGGIDYGWNDPFAALSGILTSDDVLTVFYERYKSKTPIEEHSEHLPKFEGRTVKWFADHEPELTKKLRKGGHKVRPAKKAKILGWEAVNKRILTGKLRIIKRLCPALAVEAEGYIYDVDEDTPFGEDEVDENNHACDALRYMIVGIDCKKAA